MATRDLARGSLISAALLHYYLKEDVSTATIEISDLTGTKKRMLSVATSSGIHRLVWDLRFSPTDVQRQRFLTRIQQGLERISRLPGISPLQKNAAEQESKNLNAAKTADEINRIMERLADVFDEFEPANAIVQSRFLGDPAAPGEYLIRLTAGTASASGKIVVREDPLITKR
ncbi:MAG: hypothetical protein HY046_07755 [Acidobacteria bacterium]|nr:hypothetical protein [Acidobacteriota bacterium]